MYNVNILSHKREVITPFNNNMIPVKFFKCKYVINFTSNTMVAKIEYNSDKNRISYN